jgi:heat shock protein HslJ
MKRFIVICILIAAGTFLISCAGSGVAVKELGETGKWSLDSIGGFMRPPSTANAVMTFDTRGTVSGFGGCNTFSAEYTQRIYRLKIEGLVSTEMACMESQTEALLFTALQKVSRFSYTEGRKKLNLFDVNGEFLCNFDRK